MRILFVIRDMVIGGAGKQLALTANALSCLGHDVYIYSYFGGENKHHLDSRVTYVAQEPVPSNKLKEYLLSVLHIRKQLKRIQPDVAISWRCNAGCFTVLAAVGLPVKTVFSERSDPYTETSIALKMSAFVCNFSNGGVFQTDAVRMYYKRLSSRSVVIHNPFDSLLNNFEILPVRKRKKEIVHVARMMVVQKRQDVMLKAFKIFLQKHPDYILSFYGNGMDFERVQLLARNLEIDEKVLFHGDVLNAAAEITDSRMLVLTSDYEGIPNVIMEAFAMGVPVVSTNCSPGGARVLIDNGENGFIVPVGNEIAVAEKMCNVADSDELVEKFILNGKRKLKKFEPDKIFRSWEEYLIRVAAK